MKASFKFFRHKDGVSAFASITLEAVPSSEFSVRWSSELASDEQVYGSVVQEGVADAVRWHGKTGGSLSQFTVTEFTELVVDTKPDAVRCASTSAAWKALGHSEKELVFEFDGEWRVKRANK